MSTLMHLQHNYSINYGGHLLLHYEFHYILFFLGVGLFLFGKQRNYQS